MASPARDPRPLGRMSEIAQVAVRHGFGYFFETHKLTDLLPGRRTGTAVVDDAEADVDGDGAVAGSRRGQHLREMLDELGPTFVKFGQVLSTRPDIVPPDVIAELRKLQDNVSPFPFADVERVILEELELPIERLFLEFDEQPMAAASIGQVHRAVLPNGHAVAVKVQRPDAPRQIDADIALLYQAARLARERVRALDFIDAKELVDEFSRSIRQELDYRLEARNAQTFHRNFAGHPHVAVPRVYWSYTRQRVLTLELIDGVPLGSLPFGAYTMDERRRLAYVMTEAWMTMIFRHGFFHGDPHPANLLVLSPDRLGLVDFGQAGKLTDEDMSKLTRLFIDAAEENIEILPRRLADLGVRYDRAREEEFVVELREMYYRYYGARLSEIDPIQVIRESFALIYSLNLRLPTRFVLLDKAIATLGSVGVELYPDFNVFEVAKPYARDLMLNRYTPRRVLTRTRKDTRAVAQILHDAPFQLSDMLEQLRDGQVEIGFVHKGMDEFGHKLDVGINRLVVALVVAGGLIGSSLIGIFAEGGPHVLGLHVIALIGFVLSGVLAFWLMLGVIRSGRL
jgi:ubiquinone biosynthesis protein